MTAVTWSGWKLIPLKQLKAVGAVKGTEKQEKTFGASKLTAFVKRPPIHVKTVERPASSCRPWRGSNRRLDERQRLSATLYLRRPATANSTVPPLRRRTSPSPSPRPSSYTPLCAQGITHEAEFPLWALHRKRSPHVAPPGSLQRTVGNQQRPHSEQCAKRVPFPLESKDGRPRSEHGSTRVTSEQKSHAQTDVAAQQLLLSTTLGQHSLQVVPGSKQRVQQQARPRSMQARRNHELVTTSYEQMRPSTAGAAATAAIHLPESWRKPSVGSRKGNAVHNMGPHTDLPPCVAQTSPHPWVRNLDGFRRTSSNDELSDSGDAGTRMMPMLQENGEFKMEPMFADHRNISFNPVKAAESPWPQPTAPHEWKPDAIEEETEQQDVATTTTKQNKSGSTVRKSVPEICAHTEIGDIVKGENDRLRKEKALELFLKLKLYVHKVLEPTYPMYVIHVKDFEKIGSLKSHEDLLAEGGILYDLFQLDKKTSFCIFCVHEWLDHRHPDPYKIHYRTALSYASEKMESVEQLGSKTQVYVWVDYCCLPTVTSVGQKDIPCYIARCDSLVVVAPFYRHSSGRVCDSKSFYRRGWCTLEIFCKICFSFEEHHQYVTHDGNFPGTALGAQGRGALLQTILEVNPLRRYFGCCEAATVILVRTRRSPGTTRSFATNVNHIKELALSEVSKSKNAQAARELPCDRKKLSYALIAAYAFALYKAIHLHGKWSSAELAMMLKKGRDELLGSVVPDTLAEFTESTGEHLFTAEDYANVIQLAKDGEVSGTRYSTSFELPRAQEQKIPGLFK